MRTLSDLSLGFSRDGNGQARRLEPKTFLTFGLALPISSLIALWRIATTHVELGVWITAFGMYWFSLLGVTLYYHRTLTHGGLKLKWPAELLFLIAGGLSLEGNAVDWVTKHRLHHAKSDVVGLDPHSPREYPGWRGFLWAQWFWLFYEVRLPKQYARHADLEKNRLVQWQASLTGFPLLTVLNFSVPAIVFGWNGLFIAGALRVTLLVTNTGLINSWCHVWGKRVKDSLGFEYAYDDSRNSSFVAILSGGEGFHSGHHAQPSWARHGWRAQPTALAMDNGVKTGPKFRPDLTWRVIQLLSWLRLAHITKRPQALVVFKDSQMMPRPELQSELQAVIRALPAA